MGGNESFGSLGRYRAAVPWGSVPRPCVPLMHKEGQQSFVSSSCAGSVDTWAEGDVGLCWLWLEKSAPSIPE